MTVNPTTNTGGRPVDASIAPKVLETARRLVNALGYEAVSITDIADAADVGRQTVYRRWRSKADLVLDAYMDHAQTVFAVPDGPVEQMLEAMLNRMFGELEQDRPAFRNLIAAAQSDEAFRTRFDERLSRPSDLIVESIIRKGVANGELRPDTDVTTMAEIVHGTVWYRFLLGRSLDGALAKRLSASAVASARLQTQP